MDSLPLLTAMGLMMASSGAITFLILRELSSSGKEAMVKMRLEADSTFNEFKALMWASVIQASGLFVLGFGAAFGNYFAITLGRASVLIQGGITVAVIYRWWVRFR